MLHPSTTIYHTPYVHSLSLESLSYNLSSLICVDPQGIISWVEDDVNETDIQDVLARRGIVVGDGDVEIVQIQEGEFLCPGFIDTHTHAPQYPNVGLGQEYQLLDWLKEVTFPREAMFEDEVYAEKVYESVVRRTLGAGVTTSSYYGSLHVAATKILADTVHRLGQRALVGKCNMNRNSPDYYRETSVEESIEGTKSLISHIRSLPDNSSPHPLVHPCITPRFAISCSNELFTSLSDLITSDPSLHVQTHLSENPSEISTTLSLFPDCPTYTSVYDKYSLLRKGTILAHSVWLSEEEMELIQKRKAGISHCPTSNLNLASGGARVGLMLDKGLEVGLGSDCGGGFSIGILSQIRDASKLSKIMMYHPTSGTSNSNSNNNNASSSPKSSTFTSCYAGKPLPIPALFHMATLGGASVCNLSSITGNFLPGKEFDAIRVTPGKSPNWVYRVGEKEGKGKKTKEEKMKELREEFERFLFVGDDRDIADVWVRGRRVAGSAV